MSESSPRTLLPDYEDALRRALDGVTPLAGVERVDLTTGESLGRVLAEAVEADRDYPPFDRATMDGYAVRAADVGRVERFKVVGEIAAGSGVRVRVGPGTAAKIATGAPLPEGADAVVPHEQSDRGDPVWFSIDALEPGASVHRRAADAPLGRVVLTAGTLLAAHHLGILASVGRAAIAVRRRPRVAILTSGDEVRPYATPTAELQPHQIRNSNTPMLAALVPRMGGEIVRIEHLPDDPHETHRIVAGAMSEADAVVSVGGISAGERDFFAGTFERLAVAAKVRGASIQPGRPVFVGRGENGPMVVGLPGNPVSVLATAHLFLWPLLRVLGGLDADLPWHGVTLAWPVKPNSKRQAFRPAMWDRLRNVVSVPNWSGSGDLIHTAPTDGLAALPMAESPVETGATLRFLPWC